MDGSGANIRVDCYWQRDRKKARSALHPIFYRKFAKDLKAR
jgi:hypothetical protein